jgi:ADP-heptose:LPS heptosyltransferase
MPELPDVTVYVEALESRITGHVLERVRVASPFLVRSVDPPIQALAGRPVVALIPATNMRIKRWPTAQWVRLARDLADVGVVPLLLLPPRGAPLDHALGMLPCPPLVAQVPLDRAAALLARCDLAVGVDTGLLHIAAAVGTRYVGLFGPTNPDVTGPYDRTLGTALVAPFAKTRACHGCWRQFKYIDDTCRTLPGSSCLAALPAEPVLAACLAELGRAAEAAQS